MCSVCEVTLYGSASTFLKSQRKWKVCFVVLWILSAALATILQNYRRRMFGSGAILKPSTRPATSTNLFITSEIFNNRSLKQPKCEDHKCGLPMHQRNMNERTNSFGTRTKYWVCSVCWPFDRMMMMGENLKNRERNKIYMRWFGSQRLICLQKLYYEFIKMVPALIAIFHI